jgi:hypothetical protein
MSFPQEHRAPPVILAQKPSILQLLTNPPVQITIPADIASNHRILDLLKKATTMTFETMELRSKDQERENFENAYRKGVETALLMYTSPLRDDTKTN